MRVGRRIAQAPSLPAFVLDARCPVAVVREFLGGVFGADGHAPTLHGWGESEDEASLETPAYSQSAMPEHVERAQAGHGQYRAASGALWRGYRWREDLRVSCPPCGVLVSSRAGWHCTESRCVWPWQMACPLSSAWDSAIAWISRLRASAAAVYWRTIEDIHQQRLWMAGSPGRTACGAARAGILAGAPCWQQRSCWSVRQRYSRTTRCSRAMIASRGCHRRQRVNSSRCTAIAATSRHQSSCSPQIGAREWFAPLSSRVGRRIPQSAIVSRKSRWRCRHFALQVIDSRPVGARASSTCRLTSQHAFIAGTVAVHNCIGNSGPLPEPVAEAVRDNDLVVVSVLSGNRNFEGRIHPQVRASYLASPPLVVAYALAGTTDIDLTNDPLGEDPNGQPVYLRDLWPSQQEVQETMARVVTPEIFTKEYAHVFDGDDRWRALPVPEGSLFAWDDPTPPMCASPPFFEGMSLEPQPLSAIRGARVLVSVGDSVTTDHISPAGSFPSDSPAGQYLREHGVSVRDFNSYGSRRGNHEVMMRGTFGNIRLRNQLAPGKEGYWTEYLPTGEQMTIFDASMRYQAEGTPLLVIAGKEYGSGSSRDWAAKGPMLLGIRATLAESYERIHRSNLVGMGVLPLQFKPGESRESLGLTGARRSTSRASTGTSSHIRRSRCARPARMARPSSSRRLPASIAPSTSNTTARAASCWRCCAASCASSAPSRAARRAAHRRRELLMRVAVTLCAVISSSDSDVHRYQRKED